MKRTVHEPASCLRLIAAGGALLLAVISFSESTAARQNAQPQAASQ
jgi:hypothetical protein